MLQPEAVVCLGATAAQSLVGRDVRILSDRGKWMESRWAPKLMVTVHPSALLRAEDPTQREEQYALFVRDLAMVAKIL